MKNHIHFIAVPMEFDSRREINKWALSLFCNGRCPYFVREAFKEENLWQTPFLFNRLKPYQSSTGPKDKEWPHGPSCTLYRSRSRIPIFKPPLQGGVQTDLPTIWSDWVYWQLKSIRLYEEQSNQPHRSHRACLRTWSVWYDSVTRLSRFQQFQEQTGTAPIFGELLWGRIFIYHLTHLFNPSKK